MRTAFIWLIEDLIFPGDAAEIGHGQIGQDGKEDEYDDGNHEDDCKREFEKGRLNGSTHFWYALSMKSLFLTTTKYGLRPPENRKWLEQVHIQHRLNGRQHFARVPDQS